MRKIALAVLGFIIVIFIIGAIVGGDEPDLEATPQTVPATATPVPTPAPEVEACPTEQEQAYLDAVVAQTVPMSEATSALTQLFTLVGDSPALIQDDEWITLVAVQFVTLRKGSDALFELEAPTGRTKTLQESVAAFALATYLAVDAFIVGIDNLDAEKIAEGNELLGAAGTHAGAFVQNLNSMC